MTGKLIFAALGANSEWGAHGGDTEDRPELLAALEAESEHRGVRYSRGVADHVIHISEVEARQRFCGASGAAAKIVIESGKLPVAVIHAPIPPRRSISECIALLAEDSTATIDAASPGMWRQLSKAIASHSNRPHGTNPRFQCADHSRA